MSHSGRYLLCSIACWGILAEVFGATSLAANAGDAEAYLDQIECRIIKTWKLPPKSNRLKETLRYKLARDGSVSSARVEKFSGNQSFDNSALEAVRRASPFPPPPKSFPVGDIRMILDPTLPAPAEKQPKSPTSPQRQQRK